MQSKQTLLSFEKPTGPVVIVARNSVVLWGAVRSSRRYASASHHAEHI
jgi:hypothetical protein